MRKFLAITMAAATGLAGAAVAAPAKASADLPVTGVSWSPCPDDDPVIGGYLKGLECGSLEVPLDHGRPGGRKIKLALTRAKHTVPDDQYQGIVLLNRGQWPGQFGRDLPTRFAKGTSGLSPAVGATYDWIGFDPRGTGASEPMVTCEPTYVWPGAARPDLVPSTAAEERTWLNKARDFAESCGRAYGDALNFLSTKDAARDMDLIRQALGQEQLTYFGWDYGTYLGSVYASIFPGRVRRMVLDTVVQPSNGWYKGVLEQNVTFEKSAENYFSWIAGHDATYHLGATRAEVEAKYYEGMAMVREAPVDGRIGPAEYTEVFLVNLYRRSSWVGHTKALADWVLRKDPAGLKANFNDPGYPTQNKQAMYNAVQCSDSPWPRNWKRWHNDYSRQYRAGNTFLTWYNVWYNAPCAFWPVPAGKPQKVGAKGVDVLVVQGQHVAGSPLAGAHDVHKRFPNSRLVLERNGYEHETSLSRNANTCVNGYVSAYLRDGSRPASGKGADATCEANPAPVPTP
ncbi:alpha/beta hydrolase [Streptomyces sp. KMM 9044]|uniref:alpha/beta hydrolase n=1 Tax=Streptomyces sp. KMM 9044 TaxID=2744474 RepID=UPI0022B2384B|nr:alpha/beta hydrolase [Streptomyces sp. KMM 9044]WAX76377.1 alpha/beta fold hydrolase [Streptomyces sp. KMM 9044]